MSLVQAICDLLISRNDGACSPRLQTQPLVSKSSTSSPPQVRMCIPLQIKRITSDVTQKYILRTTSLLTIQIRGFLHRSRTDGLAADDELAIPFDVTHDARYKCFCDVSGGRLESGLK